MQTWRTWRALGVLLLCLLVLIAAASYAMGGAHTAGQNSIVQGINGLISSLGGSSDIMRTAGGSTVLVKSQQQSMEGINTLELAFTSDDLLITPTDDVQLSVEWYGDNSILPEETFSLTQTGDRISVQQLSRPGMVGFMSGFSRVEIRVPKTFAQNAEVATSSGDITLQNDFTFEKLRISASSGDVLLKGRVTTPEMSVKTSSGEIELVDHLYAEAFAAQSSSGDMEVSHLHAKQFDLQTSSGELDARLYSGSGSITASSGDVEIDLLDQLERADVSTSSGSVSIRVDKQLGYDFEAKTNSGDIEGSSGVDMNYRDERERSAYANGDGQGSARVKIDVSTSSGDVDLRHSSLQ